MSSLLAKWQQYQKRVRSMGAETEFEAFEADGEEIKFAVDEETPAEQTE